MKSYIHIKEPLTLRKDILETAYLAGELEETHELLKKLNNKKTTLKHHLLTNLSQLERAIHTLNTHLPHEKKEHAQPREKKEEQPPKKTTPKNLTQQITELTKRIQQLR